MIAINDKSLSGKLDPNYWNSPEVTLTQKENRN